MPIVSNADVVTHLVDYVACDHRLHQIYNIVYSFMLSYLYMTGKT